MTFSRHVLAIDPRAVTEQIVEFIRTSVRDVLRRKGAVLGLSGGVDSSVVAALSARALGPEQTLGLLMPERDSSPDSLRLARQLAEVLGIPTLLEDAEPILAAAGCYRRQEEAVRKVFPEFGPGYRLRLTLPSLLDGDRLSVTRLNIESPTGVQQSARMSSTAYLELVAATNFKQRVRKMLEYHHADRLRYAVAGTPNRLELDQGFFVKQGDGASDLKPIAHLYKTQVYALAEYLGVPDEIRSRPPTTDTFSMAQTQEEFFFCLPYDKMDLCLYGHDHQIAPVEVGAALGLAAEQIERVYRDIEQKRRVAQYLRAEPLLLAGG
ncbi:MAG: NAD(+) synthase [Myxococcales bacterium]|nr:NAD(+) synthase [Myxococcales bacterium]